MLSMTLTLRDAEVDAFILIRREVAMLREKAECTARRLHHAAHEIEKLTKHHHHEENKEKHNGSSR